MRTSTPILLLIFLHLSSASPISLKGCSTYSECRDLISSALPMAPHFPAHQLSPPPSAELYNKLRFDNQPVHPAPSVAPSRALAAQLPLASTYLLSLTRLALGSSSPTSEALPAKPTSALSELRKADEARYWVERVKGASNEGGIEGRPAMSCAQRIYSVRYVRNYNDMMVVGIVVLFLAVVVVLELAQKVGDLTTRRRKHGAIFLADDEEVAVVVEKPFILLPAPRKCKSPPTELTGTAVEECDNHASEKV